MVGKRDTVPPKKIDKANLPPSKSSDAKSKKDAVVNKLQTKLPSKSTQEPKKKERWSC